MHLFPKTRDGAELRRSLASADGGDAAVREDAFQRQHPRTHRSVQDRVGARRIRRGHATDRAKLAARRIDRESEPGCGCMPVQLPASDPDTHPHAAPLTIDWSDPAEAAGVERDPMSYRAAGHAAARSAR